MEATNKPFHGFGVWLYWDYGYWSLCVGKRTFTYRTPRQFVRDVRLRSLS
jgi:hypothetical protein